MRRQLLFLTLALIIGASMTLFDTDRTGDDRANPAPNHSDSLTEGSVKAHKTISSHYTSDADTNTGRLQMLNKQVLANDGTTNKALFGYQQGLGLWGTFVAKPGVDVNTNTDLSQFIFNSSQNVFKIVRTGTVTIPAATLNTGGARYASGTPTAVIAAHGLGYIPAFLAFWQDGDGSPGTDYDNIPRTLIGSNSSTGYSQYTISSAVDANNFYSSISSFGYGVSDSFGPITIKYYLLQESAN